MEASDTRSDAITKIEGDKNCNRIAVFILHLYRNCSRAIQAQLG